MKVVAYSGTTAEPDFIETHMTAEGMLGRMKEYLAKALARNDRALSGYLLDLEGAGSGQSSIAGTASNGSSAGRDVMRSQPSGSSQQPVQSGQQGVAVRLEEIQSFFDGPKAVGKLVHLTCEGTRISKDGQKQILSYLVGRLQLQIRSRYFVILDKPAPDAPPKPFDQPDPGADGERIELPADAPLQTFDQPGKILQQIDDNAEELFKDLFDEAKKLAEAAKKAAEAIAAAAAAAAVKIASEAEATAKQIVADAEAAFDKAEAGVEAAEAEAAKIGGETAQVLDQAAGQVAAIAGAAAEEAARLAEQARQVVGEAAEEVGKIEQAVAQEVGRLAAQAAQVLGEAEQEAERIGLAAAQQAQQVAQAAEETAREIARAANEAVNAMANEVAAIDNQIAAVRQAGEQAARAAAQAAARAAEHVLNSVSNVGSTTRNFIIPLRPSPPMPLNPLATPFASGARSGWQAISKY